MVAFAFRYALGRQTAAVSIVVDHLADLWPTMARFDREQIKQEIAKAIKMDEAGSNCDVQEWQKVFTFDAGSPPWKA